VIRSYVIPFIRVAVVLLLACCFTLATVLEMPFERLRAKTDSSSGILVALMGDSRRLFADHFFSMADAYFHSGFYPTIFDRAQRGESHLKEETHEHEGADHHDEHEDSFLGPPKDWIERFGRHFFPTVHTHLHGGNEREILPWLKLSAEMDPKRIDTYVTASYWLRTSLNKPAEAEQFLREGLRANPDSHEILLELGRVYLYNKRDPRIARNIFVLARQKWIKEEAAGEKPDHHDYEEILGEILRADRDLNDLNAQLVDLQELIKISPSKSTLEPQLEEVKAKLAEPNQHPQRPEKSPLPAR
jgi:tetratricopeptide (TPR) repeat protein